MVWLQYVIGKKQKMLETDRYGRLILQFISTEKNADNNELESEHTVGSSKDIRAEFIMSAFYCTNFQFINVIIIIIIIYALYLSIYVRIM